MNRRKRRMDIFEHALWTAGCAVPLRRRPSRPLSRGSAIFSGVFPDVFGFAIPAVRIWWYLSGTTRPCSQIFMVDSIFRYGRLENHWFMAINYSALFMLYLWMWIESRRWRLQHPVISAQPQ
jgi:hypothetical protein